MTFKQCGFSISVVLLSINIAEANDTIYVGKKIYKSDKKTVHTKYQSIWTSDETYRGLQGDSIDLAWFTKDSKANSYVGNFTNCNFTNLYFDSKSRSINTSFWFVKSELLNCVLNNQRGDVVFNQSKAGKISISGADTLLVSLWATRFAHCKIDAVQNLSFNSSPTNDTGKHIVEIVNSTVKNINFEIGDTTGAMTYYFHKDSILSLNFNASGKEHDTLPYKEYKFSTLIQFRDCYINFPIITKRRSPGTRIHFVNCRFGPNCNFLNLLVDYIIFEDCQDFAKPIPLSTKSDDERLVLKFVNSNYRGIQVDDANNLFVWFVPEKLNDGIDNFFQTLLDKFEREGKKNSYKSSDINYRYYTENAVLWNWDKYWWNYGYAKNRVFVWTLLILLVFSMFNYCFWNQMQEVYPLFPYKSPYFRSRQTIAKRWLATILFTSFIFFSISMKLDKLNLSKNRFVIAFFFQHLVGLFLLFFILKAILKW